MATEKRFAVQVGGLEFDLSSFPDMPEEVRQYLDEMGRQLEENGAEGRNRLDGVTPQYVDDWIRASVIAMQKRVDEEGPDAVKVESMDRDWYAEYMDKLTLSTLADMDRMSAGRYRVELTKTAALLGRAWRTLIRKDKDWRALGVGTARSLYYGVVIAVLIATADMCRGAEKEDGHEEA